MVVSVCCAGAMNGVNERAIQSSLLVRSKNLAITGYWILRVNE
jgi:hypothetical protein